MFSMVCWKIGQPPHWQDEEAACRILPDCSVSSLEVRQFLPNIYVSRWQARAAVTHTLGLPLPLPASSLTASLLATLLVTVTADAYSSPLPPSAHHRSVSFVINTSPIHT